MPDFDPAKLDKALQKSLERISPITHRFEGSNANAIMAVVLGALGMLLAPIGLIFFVIMLVQEDSLRLLLLLNIPIGVGAFFYFRKGLRSLNTCVYVGEKGFAVSQKGEVSLFPITGLKEVRQTSVDDLWDDNGRPTMNRQTVITFVRKVGMTFVADRALIKQFLTFSRLMFDQTRSQKVPWKVQ